MLSAWRKTVLDAEFCSQIKRKIGVTKGKGFQYIKAFLARPQKNVFGEG